MKTGGAISTGLAVAALAISRDPAACAALEYRRAGVAAGEVWRLLTGHLPHWSGEHLLYSAGTFLVLGALLERRSPRLFVAVALGAGLAVSAAIWTLHPQMGLYRGLSGVGTALFAALAVDLSAQAARDRRWGRLAAICLVSAGLAAKLAWEALGGGYLFADSALYETAPAAHWAGALAGASIAGVATARPRARGSCPWWRSPARARRRTTGSPARGR